MFRRSWIPSLVALVSFASPALADGGSPFQLALFDPVQIVNHSKSVTGMRISLLYGRNAGMSGFDIGLVGHTTGNQVGVQWGGIGYVQGEFTGWQSNYVSIADKRFLGLQTGLVCQSKDGHGAQMGWINITDRMSGLQLGLVNYTKVMDKGLQIGIGNIITEGGIPFLPIANWRF